MKYRTFNCLEAVPSNQATIYISIHQVRAKGPDADGNFRVTIFYEVGVGEHQLLMRGQLLNSMGLILQEVHQEEDRKSVV